MGERGGSSVSGREKLSEGEGEGQLSEGEGEAK